MNINFKNVIKCIIFIVFIAMAFTIILNIMKIRYYQSIIKENSIEYSYDDKIYKGVEVVLRKYFGYVKDKEYSKIKDSSLFYADKTDFEYDQIATKLNLSDNYELIIEEVYKLDDDIFRCICYTNLNGKTSEKCSIVLKIDTDENYFKILDVII